MFQVTNTICEQRELAPHGWWAGKDSNLRRHKPADLQSAPFGRLGTDPTWLKCTAELFCRRAVIRCGVRNRPSGTP